MTTRNKGFTLIELLVVLCGVVVAMVSGIFLIGREKMIKRAYEAKPLTLTTEVGYLGGKVGRVASIDKATIYPYRESFMELARGANRAWLVTQAYTDYGPAFVYLEVEGATTLYANRFDPPFSSYAYTNEKDSLVVLPDGNVELVWTKMPYVYQQSSESLLLYVLGWVLCLCSGIIPCFILAKKAGWIWT